MNSGLKSFLRISDHFSCYSLEAILPNFFMGNFSKTNTAIICKLKLTNQLQLAIPANSPLQLITLCWLVSLQGHNSYRYFIYSSGLMLKSKKFVHLCLTTVNTFWKYFCLFIRAVNSSFRAD